MANKISTAKDIAFPTCIPGLLFTAHEYMGPTPLASPPPLKSPWGMALEIPVPMFWPPGMALGQNKLTTKTVHQNVAIVQHGHDCGTAIVHVQIIPGPLNTMTVIQILFSSRSVSFSSSNVLSEGAPTACATFWSWPPAPMMTCMDQVSLPVGDSLTSHANTVVVTMSWADILLGWVSIAASIVMDVIFNKVGKKGSAASSIIEEGWKAMAKEFGKELGKKAIGAGSMARWLAKTGVGVATGVARLALTDGPGSVKVSIGSPFLGAEVGVSRNADGDYSAGVSGNAGPVSGDAGVDRNGGKWSTERRTFTGSDSSSSSGQDNRTRYSTGANWGEPL